MTAADGAAQRMRGVYAEHHPWLYGWLRRKLGNASDAADIAHDTFLRVIASQRNLGDEPRALLTHIAKGLVVDHWRRRDVERAYFDAIAHLPRPEVPSAEARLLILEALYRIEAMLCAMPQRTSSIFLLAQLDGLTYGEIADRLGISLATVKRHMRDAFAACLALD